MLKDRCIIYEGVFDPPHIGHFWTLQQAREIHDADAIVVPATNKAAKTLSHKPKASPQSTRRYWCISAFSEIATVYNTRLIYTVDIVRKLISTFKSYKEWIYLIGPDKDIYEYRCSEEITSMVNLHRADARFDIRSSEIRDRIKNRKCVTGLLGPNVDEEDLIYYYGYIHNG